MAKGPAVFVVLLVAVHTALAVDPVPPLQWLNITPLLKGSAQPPGLKDAAMGYDETSRSLIIFGGETSSGVPQGQTYLLNLNTLTWAIPSPPANLKPTPPPRSAAVFGCDSAASNRNGFLVAGGKSSDGAALSDVWEYDFNNQFWAQVNISPGGPSARWGSSGGIDTRVSAVSDPVLPGPNNTFWLWGGSNGQSSFSDLWRLNVSGTLSSNLPGDTVGSWEQLPLANIPGKVGQGGGVLSQSIVFSGGCNGVAASGDSCALQDTYTINAGAKTGATEMAAPLNCPAPRLSPVMIPNGNQISPSFSSQMFLLLGTFNTSLWDDGGGLKNGEVAVLATDGQTWTRLLPSGDPGISGSPSFPAPREGAVAVMSHLSLVGEARTTSSDTIVFGGRDESGKYLSEVWVLRAYNAVVSPANPQWAGFGNGNLQTGVNANGAGVENAFISNCASSIKQSPPPSNSSSSPVSGGGSTSNNTHASSLLNTSLFHKFMPLSVALLMPSFLLFRLTSLSFNSLQNRALPRAWSYLSGLLGLAGYGLGIAGVTTAFTTISSSDPHSPRPPPLSTTHGQAGLALFVCLYGLVPLLTLLYASTHRKPAFILEKDEPRTSDATEKDRLPRSTRSPSPLSPSPWGPSPPPPTTPRRRTHSWGPSSWGKAREDSLSIDSGSAEMTDHSNVAATHRGFEVLNRPARTRRASGSRPSVQLAHLSQHVGSQSLGDLDWLNRRRSPTAVGELNYSLHHADIPAFSSSTPATLLDPSSEAPPPSDIPPLSSVLLRILFHASLLGLCVFCIVTLWSRAPRSTFGVFIAWTAAFYIILIGTGWRGTPDRSTISLLFARLRNEPQTKTAPRPSLSDTVPETEENGPYVHHRPTYRRALLSDTMGPQGTDTEDDDDRAEDEMRRRDISFVTSYPKRELRITNPGPS
ncbi:hypothetical protein B0H15DRAFT_829274 [Mycena belliarum]|uniref:Uncharacterized protein n=1 Tax=Mycena belliarum TaxID=1033014 RepID=A0AAD6UBR7_9AGAR|nr:hypothetical protein B0H15DRAFT_829274 [Mycena belliae]